MKNVQLCGFAGWSIHLSLARVMWQGPEPAFSDHEDPLLLEQRVGVDNVSRNYNEFHHASVVGPRPRFLPLLVNPDTRFVAKLPVLRSAISDLLSERARVRANLLGTPDH